MKFKLEESDSSVSLKDRLEAAINSITPEKASDFFGVTYNFDKAAFILPNGKCLDFSDGEPTRSRPHPDICLASAVCRKFQMSTTMAELGPSAVIRFIMNGSIMVIGNRSEHEGEYNESSLSLPTTVTDKQWKTIEDFLNYITTNEFRWWVCKEGKDQMHTYAKPYDVEKIISDIKEYLNE